MKAHSFLVLLAVFIALFGAIPETILAQEDSISISYGLDGGPPNYFYKLTDCGDKRLACILVNDAGETIEREYFASRSDLRTLSSALIADFAKTNAKFEATMPVEKDEQKRISIVVKHAALETTVAISGSDQALSDFIGMSTILRDVFGRISVRQNLKYRLWEYPGPIKSSHLKHLNPEEIKQAEAKDRK